MFVNLARGFVDFGQKVDFVMSEAKGPFISWLPAQVRVVELGTSHFLKILPGLVRYLRQERPAILLSGKRCDREAVRGRKLAGVPTRVILRVGTTVSQRAPTRTFLTAWKSYRAMRTLYPQADALIAVSKGVAEDVASITRIPLGTIHVLPNPVVTPELAALAQSPIDHPWLVTKGPPVILGVGGLRRQKDFPTLIRAFALVRETRPVRLVILGKGRKTPAFERLAEKLGVRQDVSFPGFVDNPYAYMARAGLLVLSSAWEGSPNVLVEALAVGTPVVSTDCRSGPRDILQDGRYGPLVPVGDAGAMAEAILQTLDNPLPKHTLRVAATPYAVHASTRRYLEVFDRIGASGERG